MAQLLKLSRRIWGPIGISCFLLAYSYLVASCSAEQGKEEERCHKDNSGCSVCSTHEELGEPERLEFDVGSAQEEFWGRCRPFGLPLTTMEVGCGFVRETWEGDVGDSGVNYWKLLDDEAAGGAGGAGSTYGTLVSRKSRNDSIDSAECHESRTNWDDVPTCDAWHMVCDDGFEEAE